MSFLFRRSRWYRAIIIVALTMLAASRGGTSPESNSRPRPDPVGATGTTGATSTTSTVAVADTALPVADPAAAGVDPGLLAQIPTTLANTGTDCVIVVKGGAVIHESTWNGIRADEDQLVWSVSKSITGLLVGIAAGEGKLRIDQPVADFVPEWRGTPAEAVTIRNLLSMDSGRALDTATEVRSLPAAPDQDAFAIGLPQQQPPGTRWSYSNTAVQVLDRVIERATGLPTADYAAERLFDPIGIEASWLRDPVGHASTYGGVEASCRDLARLGHLMLREGRWEGRQVVPASWVHESVQPSQQLRGDYGYLWWLNRPETPGSAEVPSDRPAPGLASNAYFARGLGGQLVAVIPDEDTVVVRTGREGQDRGRFATIDDVLHLALAQVAAAVRARSG